MPSPPVTLTFDLLTLKVVSDSRATWATSVPILVFLGLSVLDLVPMYATDRQTDRQTSVGRYWVRKLNTPTSHLSIIFQGSDWSRASCVTRQSS